MARKFLSWKAPSIESISTSLTYVALTGALVTPVLTASPRLPPAIEAHTSRTAPAEARTVAAVRSEDATGEQPAIELRDSKIAPTAAPAASAGDVRELHDLQPKQITEARSRLKSVRAREARADKSAEPVENRVEDRQTATVAILEKAPHQPESAKPALQDEPAPQPTTTVPVASDKPVAPQPSTTWSDADVTAALKECLRLLAPVNAEVEVNTAMRKGECGTPAPILLKSLGTNPKLVFQPAAEVNCQMAVALGEWATETLQPAAREIYSSDVTRIVGSSGYSCRNRYGLASERLSEHALANAIDIAGFGLANGRVIKVTTSWGTTERDRIAAAKAAAAKPAETAKATESDDKKDKSPTIKGEKSTTRVNLKGDEARKSKTGRDEADKDKTADKPVATEAKVTEVDGATTSDGRFLRRLHKGACGPFGTVLGPEANEAHRDHFHFDLKTRKRNAVCH